MAGELVVKTPKEDAISKVYYDKVYGFGSIEQTFKQVKKIDPTITRGDVKSFLDKQEVRQKKKPVKQNSFVPFGADDELQLDIAYFNDPPYRYGLVAIDVFSKKLAVIPLKTKDPATVAKTIDTVIERVGYPTSIMVDSGSEFHKEFAESLKQHDINLIVTRTSVIFAERAIRTIKEEIQKRKDALGAESWVDVLPDVVQKYNSTVKVSTGMTPLDAEKFVNRTTVREHIEGRAKFNRKYPGLSSGDRVKIIKKAGKYTEFKHDFNHWSTEIYTVSGSSNEDGQRFYTLEGQPAKLLRHEMLKVEDSQKPVAGHKIVRRGTFKQEGLRERLQPFADKLQEALRESPGRKLWTSEASKVLRDTAGFKELLKEFPSFTALLKMFPEFEILTPPGGGSSSVKLREAAAPVAPGAAGALGPDLLSSLPKVVHQRLLVAQ